MTNHWHIVEPQAITNLITNPSFETGTTGWSAISTGTLAQSAARQRHGAYSLQFTPSSASTDGVAWTHSAAAATRYGFRGHVWAPAGLTLMMQLAGTGFPSQEVEITGDNAWHTVHLFATTVGAGNIFARVRKQGSASTTPFYIDGMMLWVAATDDDQTYVDGDQPGCIWTGARHASTSQRSVNAPGGVLKNLTDTYGLIVKLASSGAGAPGVQLAVTPYSVQAGAQFQGSRATDRVLNLACMLQGTSPDNLQARRKALISLFRPDRYPTPMRRIMWRPDSGRDVYLDVVYEAGLEDQGQLSPTLAEFTLRLYAPDPYWVEDATDGALLTAAESLTNVGGIARRLVNGRWDAMGSGMGSFYDVYAVVAANASTVYVGGVFGSAGGVAGTAGIAAYNPQTDAWSALVSGVTGGAATVYALVLAPNGDLYALGDFTSIGGVAANNIAKWNGSAWSALGSGLNGSANGGCIGADGALYVVGAFTTAGGSAANRVAKWNGSAWSALGSGLSGTGYTVLIGPAGGVYIGGQFATAGGVTVNNVTKWNGTAFEALGSGLGDSVSYNVTDMVFDEHGNLYAGGSFFSSGATVFVDRSAVWNGSAWTGQSIDYPSAAVSALALVPVLDGYQIIQGVTGSYTTAESLAITSVTNTGTANTQPVVTMTAANPCQVWEISNGTTGQRLRFLNLTLITGEILTIDIPNARISSNLRPYLTGTVAPGDDFADFQLVPGVNEVGCFVTKTSGSLPTVALAAPIRHWSYDGGV